MISDILKRVRTRICSFAILICLGLLGAEDSAVREGSFEGNAATVLKNSKLELTITTKGSTLAAAMLSDDADKASPLWNPIRLAREQGKAAKFDGGAGLFVCVDGFGPVSAEERAAGLSGHGEAHGQTYAVRSGHVSGGVEATLSANLPIVQEDFTRTFRLMDGENVVLVESELKSLLAFDRPVNWAEHATIGSPFLEPGVTVVDFSGTRSQTRPYTEKKTWDAERRLTSGQDFTWPNAPGLDGKVVNVRETPAEPHYMDHATTLLDPARELEWVTALNPKTRLMVGYLFRRVDYPWLQYWGYYPASGKMARGMEFGTQPYDVPRKEAIGMGKMFETPTYRWLPAKGTIQTKFLFFYTRVPEGFRKVNDVRLENGEVVIVDGAAGQTVRLKTVHKL